MKLLRTLATAVLAFGSPVTPETQSNAGAPKMETSFVALDQDITVRRMVVHSADPKGVALLLHGFPETLYAWQDVAAALGDDYEVHAFDWPGFGLSSRPAGFGYAPRDYARVLRQYIENAGIDRSKLTIYATDIGSLPALLAALEEPGIARTIIVGDFAPFDRPKFMQERLQALKSPETNEQVRAAFNAARDEILENAMRRGLEPKEQFEVASAYRADMAQGWNHGALTTADAFARYYAQFTRDQNDFEAHLAQLKTPVKVLWGAKDVYISPQMGVEFSQRVNAELTVLPGIGHYPHLQDPHQTAAEIRAAAR
jgi:pimeloyl-ACP methyl ester carboxylesterase